MVNERRKEQVSAQPSAINGLRLVLDVHGLLQRFGKVVPDGAALLAQLYRVGERLATSKSDRTLEIYLLSYAPIGRVAEARSSLLDELNRLDLMSSVTRLGAEPLLVDTAADLKALTSDPTHSRRMGVMLMSGRNRPVAEALAAGIPAYVLSDQHLYGIEQLVLVEAERVIAEALRLPTPRPMSDESRTGSLLACEVTDVTDALERARAAIQDDPRSDWLVIGGTMLLYVESEELEQSLISNTHAIRLQRNISKQSLVLAPTAAESLIEPLFSAHGYTIGLARGTDPRGAVKSWALVRRRIIPAATSSAGQVADNDSDPDYSFNLKEVKGFQDEAPEGLLATLRGFLPASAAVDLVVNHLQGSMVTFMSPCRRSASEDLIVVSYEGVVAGARDVISKGQLEAAFALTAALLERPGSPGVLHCLSTTGALTIPMDRLLWQGEANRISALLRLGDSPSGETTVAATTELISKVERILEPISPIERTEAGQPTLTIRFPWTAPAAGARRDEFKRAATAIVALTS
ncbi:hypothetical protein [Bradyrhizobium liaoningense]|uniref:hypothetical protein n=1 Tax=Bradyrhizobium liaoningense TaxID=43992 RepID=UPI001BACB4E4|nr:hypothetical protein [Bradyrhizobium liaoningense]MBR0820271.1 hypothetical protein [Bradyrhizobium liaoningense]